MKRFSQKSCAPRRSGSQGGLQEDDQAEGQDDAGELGGGQGGADIKLYFVVGVLQLLSSSTQFESALAESFLWKRGR